MSVKFPAYMILVYLYISDSVPISHILANTFKYRPIHHTLGDSFLAQHEAKYKFNLANIKVIGGYGSNRQIYKISGIYLLINFISVSILTDNILGRYKKNLYRTDTSTDLCPPTHASSFVSGFW